MTKFILIDSYAGFIWGEAFASSPIEACRTVDKSIGGESRVYEEFGPNHQIKHDGFSGYFVHEAPDDFVVTDGQNQGEIEAVEALPLVAIVTYSNQEA